MTVTNETGSAPLKILVYGLNYAPWSAGIPKYTGELAAGLARRGHEVEAIAGIPHYPAWKPNPAYAGKGFHTEHIDGVRIHRTPLLLPRGGQVGARDRILMESSFTLLSLRYWLPIMVRSGRFDVVLAICPPMQSALIPWLYSLARSVPWLLHVQDLQVDAAVQLGMLRGGAMGKVLLRIEKALLRRATAVSTISGAMCRKIKEKGVPDERVRLCPNWADIDAVRPGPRMNSFRKMLEVGEEQVVLMCAGSMGEKHGLALIVEAAERLRADDRYSFVLIGDGSARPGLEHLAESKKLTKIRFLPLQPLDALSEMLAAADVHFVTQQRGAADLVMPSRLTNIFASGRPVIATADQGTELFNVVESAGAGLVCSPGDLDGFVDTIRIVGEDSAARARMGRRAREYAEACFGKEPVMSEFERILRRLHTRYSVCASEGKGNAD